MVLRKDNKFRFHLQWEADTQERIQVGTFLEQLGNRKSVVVIEALKQYMLDHPEILPSASKVVIQIHASNTEAQILEKVQSMIDASVDRRMANLTIMPANGPGTEEAASPSETDMDEILQNLELFS